MKMHRQLYGLCKKAVFIDEHTLIKLYYFGPCICYSFRVNKKEALLLERPLCTNIRGSLNKFPHFFLMGTFIDSTHMEL